MGPGKRGIKVSITLSKFLHRTVGIFGMRAGGDRSDRLGRWGGVRGGEGGLGVALALSLFSFLNM